MHPNKANLVLEATLSELEWICPLDFVHLYGIVGLIHLTWSNLRFATILLLKMADVTKIFLSLQSAL